MALKLLVILAILNLALSVPAIRIDVKQVINIDGSFPEIELVKPTTRVPTTATPLTTLAPLTSKIPVKPTTRLPTTATPLPTLAPLTTKISVKPTTRVPTTVTPLTTLAPPTTKISVQEGSTSFTSSDGQRFLLLTDETRSWSDSNANCTALGLQLAHPRDPIELRRTLVNDLGLADYTWMNAVGTGIGLAWADDGTAISQSSTLLYGQPVSTYNWSKYIRTDRCLSLLTYESEMNDYPNAPYIGGYSCFIDYWTLCQH